MADNDSYEKDMEEIFGETRGERERKRLKQISDAAAESVRLANDFKQELKKEEIQSDDPIIQKCLDIVRNKKVTVKDLSGEEFYRVYIGDEYQFSFHKYDEFDQYQVGIDFKDWFFYQKRPDLEELYRLCVAKYKERSQEREKNTLDFLNDADKDKKTNKNNGTATLLLLAGLAIAGMATPAIFCGIQEKKAQRVKKQVDAYEKTLPAEYMEYKHAVEHYRDSLMHAKRR